MPNGGYYEVKSNADVLELVKIFKEQGRAMLLEVYRVNVGDATLDRRKQEKEKKVLKRNKVLQKKEDPLHREEEEQDKKILLRKKLLVKEEDPLHRFSIGFLRSSLQVVLYRSVDFSEISLVSSIELLLFFDFLSTKEDPGWQIWFGSSSQRTGSRLGDSGPLLNVEGVGLGDYGDVMLPSEQGAGSREQAWVIMEMGCCRRSNEQGAGLVDSGALFNAEGTRAWVRMNPRE
ncbi:hypothetical protein NE237_024833 [Protea cynaroides]|uniref:Uncharacterized protein n=1 Tax=Protea cynaroides TaxID=273540 RepID=A0A9Q0JZZ4_9MAGN|nr:hypothetical protein NE237_024833 [Protea cynaroides]